MGDSDESVDNVVRFVKVDDRPKQGTFLVYCSPATSRNIQCDD